MQPTMTPPPMTGVPALSNAEGTPVSRSWSTRPRRCRYQMNRGVMISVRMIAVSAAPIARTDRYSVSRSRPSAPALE